MRKSVWLLSAGLFALSCSGIRSGHQPRHRSRHRAVARRNRPPSNRDGAGRGRKPSTGEIIVTAQGRRQVLQDVPIAVTAVGAEEMQNSGATDIRQLNQLAPSLLVSSTGTEANGSARIRGIGTVGDNPGLESSVAVFIDGVYRSRSGIGLNELGEIDRIEVLRGPQGTLFGRNASAGLINIITKRPSFDSGGLWRSDDRQLRPAPPRRRDHRRRFSDTLAARIDGVYVKRDGFYDDRRQRHDDQQPQPLSSPAASCCSSRPTTSRSG